VTFQLRVDIGCVRPFLVLWLYIEVHQDNPGFGTFTWRLISMPHALALAPFSFHAWRSANHRTFSLTLYHLRLHPFTRRCAFDVTEQIDYDDRTCIPSDLNRTQISAVMIALREFWKNLAGKPPANFVKTHRFQPAEVRHIIVASAVVVVSSDIVTHTSFPDLFG